MEQGLGLVAAITLRKPNIATCVMTAGMPEAILQVTPPFTSLGTLLFNLNVHYITLETALNAEAWNWAQKRLKWVKQHAKGWRATTRHDGHKLCVYFCMTKGSQGFFCSCKAKTLIVSVVCWDAGSRRWAWVLMYSLHVRSRKHAFMTYTTQDTLWLVMCQSCWLRIISCLLSGGMSNLLMLCAILQMFTTSLCKSKCCEIA